jgi:hypothetical protein
VIAVAALALAWNSALAQGAKKQYEVPPSSRTQSNVPYISDQAMQACVKLYNEAKWLSDELKATRVDRSSRSAVDTYNAKVRRHSGMIDTFNRDCAGKQSESAWRAAQELNKQKQ